MSKIHDFTDKNFLEEVEQFGGTCIVDFWAPWCVPCKMQSPAIDEISAEYDSNENVKIGKVNVDDNNMTAGKYGVMSIPTVIIYKAGVPVDKTVGVASASTLKQKIDKTLA
jgi:thioredoxin